MSFSDTMHCHEKVRGLATELLITFGLADWRFALNRRKREMGLCLYGPKRIALSVFFVDMNDWTTIRDTLLHEIAHALVGEGHGHDGVWKQKCREIGARPERLGYDALMPEGRWQAICGGCGLRHHRHRRPKHLVGWYCCHCGRERGKLIWGCAG